MINATGRKMQNDAELFSCEPLPLNPNGFNAKATLPYGLQIEQIEQAMGSFLNFLKFINQELNRREIARLEMMLMPANFSSIVGEFMTTSIPKFCPTLAKNKYHNGHPDLVRLECIRTMQCNTAMRESKSKRHAIYADGKGIIQRIRG